MNNIDYAELYPARPEQITTPDSRELDDDTLKRAEKWKNHFMEWCKNRKTQSTVFNRRPK